MGMETGMLVDTKPLDFPAIQRLLERYSSTPYGADAARTLEPAPDPELARALQRAASIARARIEALSAPSMEGITEVRPALRQARNPGAALSVQALQNLRSLLQTAQHLSEQLADAPELHLPGSHGPVPPQTLIATLSRILSPGGSLREDANPALRDLHVERQQLRTEVEKVVTAKWETLPGNETIRRVHWHQERAVLVLKPEVANEVKGVRRGSEFTGREVIIEPMEAVVLNNRLEAVNEQITREQQRLLRATTDEVREQLEELESLLSAITWIDLAFAAGRLSQAMNAHAPSLVEQPVVQLNAAYHPLLLLQFVEGNGPQPIPLSMELLAEQPLLLITGPNTGGKTVALKTVGLLVTMAWCGLHIPAEGDCVIGHFDRVMVDVGDHQSVLHHLSTFAGHVEVLKRVLENATANSLILLDELGTGTDPDEGAALAMAVLDELRERGVFGIVNTHLAPLKTYAAQTRGILNASMQFDRQRLVPTFRLLLGEPGVSFGLTIAESRGLSPGLVDRARAHLERLLDRQPR